jgi:methionine-rich copper-binding protein CopC
MISATPSADSVSRGAPSVAELVFSADISPGQSGIDVRSQNGARFDQHNLHTVGDAKHIAVGLRLLNPGHYTVRWHATGVAGQHVAGSYGFYVTAGS